MDLKVSKKNCVASGRMKSSFIHKSIQLAIIIIILFIQSSKEDSDWLKDCGACHCHWNSGKKSADCKNRDLTTIPKSFNPELQVLDLSQNVIPELYREQFYDANLQNLHKIYLKNCTLQAINRDALKGLAILIELDLSNNLLKTLPVGIFVDTIKLRNLIMNNNEIEILENNLFRDLEYLIRVEFKNNRIKKIEPNVFVNVLALQLIYLESNRLSILKKEIFENLPVLRDLKLAQNPWNCTCELQEFRDFLVNKNLYTEPTSCQEPAKLKNKFWPDVPSEQFACRPKVLQPRLGGNSAYMEATTGNVTMNCRIRGNPKPNVVWIYNKRPINLNDPRVQVFNYLEKNRKDYANVLVSELRIFSIRASDKGAYTCIAENSGGRDEGEINLIVNTDRAFEANIINSDSNSNLWLIICIVAIVFLLLIIVIVLVLCWYCQKIRHHYMKDVTMRSENALISSKAEKAQNGSVLEGSVIVEMQKSLLTEVNPVEKPPRRTEIESVDTEDGYEIKKTLLDDTSFGNHDEETNSIALSDTTPRSRTTFVDDGYGTNLPPDLLSFPTSQRVPQSPSLQSSMSNLPDNRALYCKSPLSSPINHVIYSGLGGNNNEASVIYGQTVPSGFRTLQHSKNRNLATQKTQSPFIPAPVVYPMMKQGYMTIPRKPRVPSWTPTNNPSLSEYIGTSVANSSVAGSEIADTSLSEPVYDNLGLRTTAAGNSILSLNKIGLSTLSKQIPSIRYTMKDRPLPATPNNIANQQDTISKIYEPIQELTTTSDTEPLYGTARNHSGVTIVPSNNAGSSKISKIPPRPPPKPKKHLSVVTATSGGSTRQLFDDEGEDGTEV